MPKVEALYLTESEIAARVGVSLDAWRIAASTLEKSGLPLPNPLFGNRRHWPAVRDFLDRRENRRTNSPAGNVVGNGEERWTFTEPTRQKRRA